METPADAMAEAMGVGKSSVWWWRLTAVSACISTIGLAAWLCWEVKTEPTVVPYVLILDDETRVLDSIRAKEWQPRGAAYADVARRWVTNIRTRSPNDAVTNQLREEAKRLTDKSLYRQVSNLMLETDEQLKGDGIEVNPMVKATPLSVEADQALVRVEWKERKYKRGGNAGAWAGFYGTLSVARVEPAETGEIQSNPLGLYITSFTFAASGPDLSQVQR